ncbi:prolipoprotein diacylglyceryl transferase [Olsenella massiliensis]|uniref:prolipoprotein diacylglyceryl transferase n=1 Tax=Olsenella massiliensis TaxID=1622075 RepID=UPI00071E1A40|nr:prolipoprotein diacylglyceryl transferase [Olsenella massiliensis]
MWLDELYHALNPVALQLGPLAIRWYGLAYLAGFALAGLMVARNSRRWGVGLTADDVTSVVLAVALGVIVGARLGYVLFYGDGYYLQQPLKVFALSEGGMSFHGGLVGAVVGGLAICRSLRVSFATMCDLVACGAPLGLFFGRCANFINGELWGKETSLPWGVMFSDTGGGLVYRHPSQLYEALLEGVILFVLLYLLARRRPTLPQGTFLGTFLVLYGCFRFLVEFVRLPDKQLGYLFGTGWLTMGQCLSLPLVLAGAVVALVALRRGRPQRGHLDD